MLQITIALIIGGVLGYWISPIIEAGKIAALEAFGEELGEIILKQKQVIADLKFDIEA